MDLPTAAESLVTPLLAGQFGPLSSQDKAFLNVFSRQEQQELHGVPRPDPVDPGSLLGQLEQVVAAQGADVHGGNAAAAAAAAAAGHGHMTSQTQGEERSLRMNSNVNSNNVGPEQHEFVEELAPEEVRWFYKRDLDKLWTSFGGFDSLRLEKRFRHVYPNSGESRATQPHQLRRGHHGGRRVARAAAARRTQSLNRGAYGHRDAFDFELEASSGLVDNFGSSSYHQTSEESYSNVVQPALVPSPAPNSPHYTSAFHYASTTSPPIMQGSRHRGPPRGTRRAAGRAAAAAGGGEAGGEDPHVVVVRGGVYEVNLVEWKCTSIYWPGESFDLLRGTWFYEANWQPVASEFADKVEREHLERFRGHKIADYEALRNEKQVYHTASFPEFHVDWLSPSSTFLHRETTSSQLYRGLSSSLGFRKPTGERLCRGYRECARHSDRLSDITHLVFVVHGVGQVMDDTTIIRNTNVLREHFNAILSKRGDRVGSIDAGGNPDREDGPHPRVEFFPVEWRSSLRLDDGMVRHVTPQRIMGLRNLLNSSAMDIMYYTSPLYRMEIYHTLQEELNRLYDMFVQRNPNFEANQGQVSIVAHSLGCVVAYDILTGFTLDVEAAWQSLQARNVGQELKMNRRMRMPGMGGQTGLLFRIEHFFCLGSPLSVFLLLRWRDPTNQEYHEHILPRSLCKYLYNVYHPCDPVAYRVEPIFMKFYSKVEPVHVCSATEVSRTEYSQLPLQPLQNARKDEGGVGRESGGTPSKTKLGSSLGKILPNQGVTSVTQHLPKALVKMNNNENHGNSNNNDGNVHQEAVAGSGLRGGPPSAVKEAVNQVAGEVLGGVWDRMRDAVKTAENSDYSMAKINAHFKRTATLDHSVAPAELASSSSSTTSSGNKSNSMVGNVVAELRPPDGQRLAYRMDYVLRETGNTYIAAMVSHTAYWSNPDVARFMVDKLYPDTNVKDNVGSGDNVDVSQR